jgi:hypothetical protein
MGGIVLLRKPPAPEGGGLCGMADVNIWLVFFLFQRIKIRCYKRFEPTALGYGAWVLVFFHRTILLRFIPFLDVFDVVFGIDMVGYFILHSSRSIASNRCSMDLNLFGLS